MHRLSFKYRSENQDFKSIRHAKLRFRVVTSAQIRNIVDDRHESADLLN